MQSGFRRRLVIVAAIILLPVAAAAEEQEFAGTLHLRGGYDSNPTSLPGRPPGSAFISTGAAFAAASGDDDSKIAVSAEAQHTEYSRRGLAPSDRAKLALDTANNLGGGWMLRTSTRGDNTSTYDLNAFNAVETVKLRREEGVLRPFITGELRYASLNETNILFADFLPEPERFVRAAAIPGAVIARGKGELGVSVSVSSTRYIDGVDALGFRRDNTRIQPFVFFNFKDQGLSVAASVSRLYGRWADAEFPHVNATLYDVSVSKEAGDFKLDLSARSSAEDTTFPYVPVILASSRGASVSYKVLPRLTLRSFLRQSRSDYLGLGLASTPALAGVGASYDCGDGWTLGAEASRTRGRLIDGEATKGVIASMSLTKVFKNSDSSAPRLADRRQWAALAPPTGQSAVPGWEEVPPPPHQP